MRATQVARVSWLVSALGVCLLVASAARADVAAERPGSILIFPKVVRDGTRDTLIQMSNTGNVTNMVRCFYLNSTTCDETDFELALTKQQPTHWDVDTGRRVDPFDPFGSDEAGLDPGLIPPAPFPFTGALICVEVDVNGVPVAQNKLKGEASLFATSSNLPGVYSRYNAIAITGGDGPNVAPTNKLDLNGHEYSQCPAALQVNFVSPNVPDPVIDLIGNTGRCANEPAGSGCRTSNDCLPGNACIQGGSGVVANLTLVPCNLDFENGLAKTVKLSLSVETEFEETFSVPASITCWGSFDIGSIANRIISSTYATASITPASGGPVVGIVESFYSDSISNTASAANNLHMIGGGANATILLADQ